ncbi:MAG: AraC family transcriptional regulator ligand-binding domain-containing protein [Henriciella sp.]
MLNPGAAATIVAFALSRDISEDEILAATGVTCHEAMNPSASVSEDFLPKLWNLIGEKFPNEPTVLEMARGAPFSFFGGLAHAVQFAENLRQALKLFSRHSTTITSRLQLEFIEGKEKSYLVSRHPLDSIDGGRSAECGAALAARLFTDILGLKSCIIGAEFAHAPFCDLGHYEEFFGGSVEFLDEQTGLVFDSTFLDAPVRQANLKLFRFAETHIALTKRENEQTTDRDEFSKFRDAVQENALIGIFSARAAAIAANMSLRTAQRLVAARGTTIQHIMDQVRERRAKELLENAEIGIGAIASSLGYADERAFRRAFKRWTGRSPFSYRTTLLAASPTERPESKKR